MKKRIGLVLVAAVLLNLSGCSEPDEEKKEPPKLTQLDQRLTLVESAGLMDKHMPMKKLMEQYVSVLIVDLTNGEHQLSEMSVDDSFSYVSPSWSKLADYEDLANITQREDSSPVYLVNDDSGNVTRIVLPVRAQGKNGLLFGYLALYPSEYQIAGLAFYRHKETAGLGAEITDNQQWKAQFSEQPLFKNGKPSIRVVQEGHQPQGKYTVDGISGATYTSKGVEHAVNFWAGEQGFGKFLKQYADHKHR